MPPETSVWRALRLKTDFLSATPLYLDLLQKWAALPNLTSETALRRILYRYEILWLPLASEWFQTDLQPPLDVHWAWHMHMMHPKLYTDYCLAKFGRILPHKIRLLTTDEIRASERTRLIWKDKYANEPFDLDVYTASGHSMDGSNLWTMIQTSATAMQFAQQVSLPHYRDANFLNAAMDRYRRFLSLKKLRPYARIAPPIDILLMWRIHALHPVEYQTEALQPYNLTSLSEHVQLDGRCLLDYGYNDSDWSAVYRDPLLVPGSAYRGSYDYSVVSGLPKDDSFTSTVDKCHIVLDNLLISEVWSRDKKLLVVVRLLGKSTFSGTEILRLETTVGKTNTSPRSSSGDGLVNFHFDAKENRGVEFSINAIRGLCSCTQGDANLNTMVFFPREPFGEGSFTSRDFVYSIPKISQIDAKISFQCRLRAAAPQPHILSLERKALKAKPLPKQLIPFVRDLPKWRDAIARESPGDNGLEFTSAKHSLKNREHENMEFCVEVIKQNDLDLGAVLVHHNDDLLVTSYTVGEETLASPQQLTRKCPVQLDLEEEELAMLISNQHGEWGVCRARWEADNDEGRVKVKIYFLQSRKDLTFYIRDDEMQAIKFGDISIDMPTGRLSLDPRNPDIAENVALAFCVGILYVSCQVRATILMASKSTKDLTGSVRSSKSYDLDASSITTPPPNKIPTTPKFTVRRRNKKHARKRKMSASFTFLLATGLQIDVTLYGSTGRNQRPVSRASLASLHLLYESAVSDNRNPTVDTRNNNNTTYTYDGSMTSAPPSEQLDDRTYERRTGIYRQNWENAQQTNNSIHLRYNGRPASSHITANTLENETSYGRQTENSTAYEYMDIRL